MHIMVSITDVGADIVRREGWKYVKYTKLQLMKVMGPEPFVRHLKKYHTLPCLARLTLSMNALIHVCATCSLFKLFWAFTYICNIQWPL